MTLAGPSPDPAPTRIEPRRGAFAGSATAVASIRWVLLVGLLVPLVAVAHQVTLAVLGEGPLTPIARGIGTQAWGLVAGIGAASALALGGRRVPRPAGALLVVTWLLPAVVLGLATDLRALDRDPDLAMVAGVIVALFVLAVALVGWSLRLSVRLTLLVVAGILGGASGVATTGALARRDAGTASALRTGRELAMVSPLVVLLPVLLVALVMALATRLLPDGSATIFAALALGAAGVPAGDATSSAAPVAAIRLAIVVPVLAALALGIVAADRPGVAEPADGAGVDPRRPRTGWAPLLLGGAVLGGAVLAGTVAAAAGTPLGADPSAGDLLLAVAFVAIGLRAPTRPSGPWSAKLALVVGIGATWLVVLTLVAALALSARA